MYNIPITLKLRQSVELGDTPRVERILKAYDLLIHPTFHLHSTSEPTTQIEFYELQIARWVSWTGESLHFVERIAKGDFRGRRIGFMGFDAERCVKRYWAAKHDLEHWFIMRHGRKIKKGAAAAEAYRSGFLEAVLDRVRIPHRKPEFYTAVFQQVKLRDILTPSRRELRDQAARSAGLDDGLICDLTTLKSSYAESLCGGLDEC